MNVEATSPRRNGLAIVWDVLVAPADAFAALAARTHWGWAFVVVCVLGTGGALLQIPASVHLAAATLAQRAIHDPNLAAMSAENQQHLIAQAQQIQRYAWLFFPVIAMIAILVAATIMLLGNAVARGTGRFGRLFGLAANVAVINFGIGYLLIGVLVAVRGPAAFSTQGDILAVLPSLVWFFPAAPPKLATFLATFNPLEIWSFVLLAMGLRRIAGIRRTPSYVTAAVVSFGSFLLTIWSA